MLRAKKVQKPVEAVQSLCSLQDVQSRHSFRDLRSKFGYVCRRSAPLFGLGFRAKKRFDLSVLNYIVTSNHIPLLVKDTGPECYCSLRTGYAHHERNSLDRFAPFKSFRKLTCALSARLRQLVHKSFANLSRRKRGMAFSRPKAIGGLAVDNDHRDDAQSASVVCRNQLGNPFSVVFVLRAGARSDFSQFLNVGLFRILCASPKSANEKRDPKCTKPEDL